MIADKAPLRVININPEHGGIRIGVVLSMLLGLIFGYFFVRYFILNFAAGTTLHDFVFVTSCVLAIPLAAAITWGIEKVMKSYWPSGLVLIIDDHGLRFADTKGKSISAGNDEILLEIDFSERFILTRWYFTLRGYPKGGRERTVPEKWFCLACQFQQDEKILVIFSYLAPESTHKLVENQESTAAFEQISMAEIYQSGSMRPWKNPERPTIDSSLLAGPRGRHWLAERRRWEEGFEVTGTDFSYLMDFIEQQE